MIENLHHVLHAAGLSAGYAVIALLCLGGLILSCLSLSGTWLVTLGCIAAVPLGGKQFPGWGTVIAFLVIAAGVEVLETFAGSWGVKRRGGSGWAGLAAFAGGLIGLFLGTAIPIPLVGSLIGMLLGSFALAYAVERYRLNHGPQAAHIARGAVLARLAMLLVKVLVTLGLTAWLWIGILTD